MSSSPPTETVFRTCPTCEASCGLVAEVEQGRVVGLEPNKTHQGTLGFSCMKGLHQHSMYDSPDRLQYPLKRVGDSFERISWDQALRDDDILGEEGLGLQTAQLFVHENRIRQAASSLGAAQHCIDLAVDYANNRITWGKKLSINQGIQFPLVELQTQCEMLRALIHKTAWQMDTLGAFAVSDKVSMCNYWSNRLCCEAADRAMGGQRVPRVE